MNALLTYAVGSAAVLAVLWGGFRLLLRSQKTFRVNRILLNVILYFSLCAPLLLSCLSIPVPDGRDQGAVGLMTLSGITVSAGDVGRAAFVEDFSGRIAAWLPEVLVIMYLTGASVVLLVQVLLPAVMASGLILRGRRHRTLIGGRAMRVVSVPARKGRRVEPMSWLGVIILPAEEKYDADSYVVRHEAAHIRMGHSALLLNASLLLCLQWFNPAAWLLLRDLKQNCEFEADDAVLSSGADRRGYQLSLVGQAARGLSVSLASPFRNSSLYRRITMIQKAAPKGRMVYARLLYVVPVVLAAVLLFARPLASAEDFTLPVPYSLVDEHPGFMGGDSDDFTRWVYSRLQYPEAARSAGAGARVTVGFTINVSGELTDIHVVRVDVRGTGIDGFDYSVFGEAVMDVVRSSPNWTPGRMDGVPVNVSYYFPVSFQAMN